MNLHEYQAKVLLSGHDVAVPAGEVAVSADQAREIATGLGGDRFVVKAQIHAGSRGDGHFLNDTQGGRGIRFADTAEQVREHAAAMLGHTLVTPQTGPGGREVVKVYVEQACDVERELYLGMLVDRATSRVTLLLSARGGIDIEKIALDSPGAIHRLAVDPDVGLNEALANDCVARLRLQPDQQRVVVDTVLAVYRMFLGLDASMIEINPLALLRGGGVSALDAVVAVDNNALYRQPDVVAMRDETEVQTGELEASRHGLNYFKLDGNIGCIACGAGMAMATNDAVRYLNGRPANFLDVPPDTGVDRIKDACRLLMSDPDVACILVNVFGGGIMRCDHFADGILLAHRESPLQVPMVVRLAGTNASLGIQRLRDSGPSMLFAADLASAAETAVRAAQDARESARKSWWQRTQNLLQGGD